MLYSMETFFDPYIQYMNFLNSLDEKNHTK